MILAHRVVPVLLAVTILFLYTITDSVTNDVLAAKKNRDQPHITFNSPGFSLEKIDVDVKQDREGWTETAKWGAASGSDLVFVNIFAHVAYRKIIMSSHVRPPDQRVFQITGGETVSLGGRGKAEIEPGFYEYQAYHLNEVPCVYIQSYWTDRSFGGIDVVRGADPSDRIVGNHMLQVVVCDQRKNEFVGKDVAEILASIGLRDAHWSKNWFVDEYSSEVPQPEKEPASISKLEQQPSGEANLSLTNLAGTYQSEITYTDLGVEPPNLRYYFGKSPDIQVRIDQNGGLITAAMEGDRSGSIKGVVEGSKITFEFDMKVPGGTPKNGTGVWVINDGRPTIDGTWEIIFVGRRLKGNWKLTRIE